ncbi:MgtC/SapB family protein [Vulgatibacter sp.]|uniref:MgtC/SapB family protein n=1 Tax=Vulgatibacter sp. TaxID=1971226 RepID=UPI003569C816
MDLGGWEEWGRLLAAVGAGGALGLRAELQARPAGLRTHILVAVGSAVFCLTAGPFLDDDFSDPLRALQGVASGIGLVAAATVLKRERGVSGLTTAASIWLAAALGCDAALGRPLRAFVLGVLFAALSQLLRVVERRWLGHDRDSPP